MKKSPFLAAIVLLGVAVSGCPVYDGDDGCFSDVDCPNGAVCDGRSGICVAEPSDSTDVSCRRPKDCGTNETCSRFGTCSSGDCHFSSVGCVYGYECSPDSGRWECVPVGSAGGEAGQGGTSGAGTSGGQPNAGDGGMSASAGAGGYG